MQFCKDNNNHKIAEDIKSYILSSIDYFKSTDYDINNIPDDFDLLDNGAVDSLGFMMFISSIENHFNITIDFDNLDPDEMTVIGPLINYISNNYKLIDKKQV